MKLRKILCILVFVLVALLVNVIDTKALGPIYQPGSRVLDDSGYGLALKGADSNGDSAIDSIDSIVFCTDYDATTPAGTGITCSINSDWSEAVRYGVAAIISESKSSLKTSAITDQYFAAELAINHFLYLKSSGGHNITGTLSSTYSTLYSNYLSVANTAYDNYSTDSTVSVNLSSSSLTFTLSGSNWISNEITVSGVSSYTATTDLGTVEKSGNTFKVVVPVSSVTSAKTVKVTVTSSKSLNQARNYTCGSYQSVTPVALETVTKTGSASASGTITPKASLTINKVDNKNVAVVGATLTVTGTKGYSKTFVTDGNPIVIENLEYDTYTIKETKVPDGYISASDQTVTLSSTNLSETVKLVDKLTKISIVKVEEDGKTKLPGAILKLTDSKGKVVNYCKDSDNKAIECMWISVDEAYVIEGLPIGTYYIEEVEAPDGYDLLKDKIKVVILEDGTVEIDGEESKNAVITVVNNLTRTQISKVNAVNGKELPGATLQVLNENKEKMTCTVINKDGEEEELEECLWVSGEDPVIIIGLKAGKYYLAETIAPEGYEKNENMVEFEVKADGTTTEVKMVNELIVEVPDTLSAKSALLISIAMFDIALGIGILLYVKRNKIEE